jgi:hypothetical protein
VSELSGKTELGELIHELVTACELSDGGDPMAHDALEELLLGSSEARQAYLAYMHETAVLHLAAHQNNGRQVEPLAALVEGAAVSGRVWQYSAAVGWAAVLALAFLLVWVFQGAQPVPDTTPVAHDRPMQFGHEGVAMLTRTVEAKWAGSNESVGPVLKPGILRLLSGSVQIDFESGASVILQGPATFEIISRLRARLHRGKMHAEVPPHAKGFTVAVKDLDVVDYGTEFGLELDKEGNTEVHVIKGEVRVRSVGMDAGLVERKLTTGQGMLIRATGMLDSLMADAASFIRLSDLLDLEFLARQKRHEQWIEFSKKMAKDPDLVAYYTFENQSPADRSLKNRASHHSGEFDGAIIGCEWEQGRWPNKGSLEFKQGGDRVRINIPDEFEALTLMASVRIDGFDRQFSSLMLTDGWDRAEPHWQVSWSGELILGVYGSMNSRQKGVLSQADVGRWINLTSVYDPKAKAIRHYRDGRLMGSHRMWTALPFLVIGSAQIGNWDPVAIKTDTLRNLNGRIDELAIFKRALSDKEIRRIVNAGRPY